MKPVSLPDTGYTVTGWLHSHNYRASSLEQVQELGRQCVRVSKELGLPVYRVHSEAYGWVNSYQVEVLQKVIPIRKTPF